MKLLSIASGSSGNCIYVSSEDTRVLIDAGISNKRIEEGLHTINVDGNQIDALLITHEHADHVKGLGVLARRYKLPIYATKGTLEAIKDDLSLGDFPYELLNAIYADDSFNIGSLSIKPFHIHHDAADPVGYRVSNLAGDKTVTIATDMGHYDEYIIDSIKGSNALLIEANHDVHMLEAGPYPYYLKRRILSDFGHLSNENCGKLICEVMHPELSHIILGHLSKENNYPDLALAAVKCEMSTILGKEMCSCHLDSGEGKIAFALTVANRTEPSQLIEI